MVKSPPAQAGDACIREDPVLGRSPGGGIHSRILAGRIPRTEEQSWMQLSEHAGAQEHTLYIQGS